ncbi:MAG: hypothetical protein JST06_02900 [Bacteroidetes bacterium]|nr:hypothetical protein [Bacteroidota bacterium]
MKRYQKGLDGCLAANPGISAGGASPTSKKLRCISRYLWPLLAEKNCCLSPQSAVLNPL